jgi:hypothetical protein
VAWTVESGDVGSSIVNASLRLTPPYLLYFQTSLAVAKDHDYLTSIRGIETMVLQLDNGVLWTNSFANFAGKLGVDSVSIPSLSVYVVLPASARDIQSFPETSQRKPLPYYLTSNATVDSIEWDLAGPTTITLSYVDDTVAGQFELYLVVGSILLGAAISEGLDLAIKGMPRTTLGSTASN